MSLHQSVRAEDGVVELEFRLTDRRYPFIDVSAVEGYRVVLEELFPREDGAVTEFFTITGGPPEEILALVRRHDESETTLLSEYEDGGLFELRVTGNCPALFLVGEGALPRSVYAVDGTGHVVADVPPASDAGAVVDAFLTNHDDADLVARRQQPYQTPLFNHREFVDAVEDYLSDRQREILRVAHEGGYYAWPRETSGDELASELGIAAATFHQHLRAAERKIITLLFGMQTDVDQDTAD